MYIQIQVSVPSQKLGYKIAKELLAEKLVACVQILGPMQSHYIWEGNQEQIEEFLLLIKSRSVYYSKIEQLVQELHSYEVPEIIYTNLHGGLASYLKWIDDQTQEKAS